MNLALAEADSSYRFANHEKHQKAPRVWIGEVDGRKGRLVA
jgi:hypothetical protein